MTNVDGAVPVWEGRQTLPEERSGHPAPPAIAALRAAMAGAVAAGRWRTAVPPVEEVVGGVRVLRFRPPGTARAHILHFHGGGYRMGCPEILGPYAAALAERCGVEVLCPAYRLAPEYPFPSGLQDGLAVLRALAVDEPIIVSGDSAGGGLAAALTIMAAQEGVELSALVLLSPWLDLRVMAPSYDANGASDPLFSREAADLAARLYLQGHDAADPFASPVLASMDAFPPVLLSVGSGEVLLDDARTMARRLDEAGRSVELHIVLGMDHIAAVRGLDLPGAAETFALVAAFIDRCLA